MDKHGGREIGVGDVLHVHYSTYDSATTIEELLARIRVTLTRHSKKSREEEKEDDALSFEKLKVDVAGHQITYDGEEVVLTKKEFDLLELLMKRAS